MRKQGKSGAHVETWPDLPFETWKDTYATLHMWTQIVGKLRLARAPMVNHWWQVPLYVTARGLTTSPVPCGLCTFEITFDFLDHQLRVLTSDGDQRILALKPQPVADFYKELMAVLHSLGLELKVWTMPVEVEHPIAFDEDYEHHSYEAEFAQRFWRILVQTGRVFQVFRGGFLGKCSPVHFFWGSFDLAVTRFSGRRAPVHPGGFPHLADRVTRESYSHEVSSCGFWPGGSAVKEPVFYAYAYPEPEGYGNQNVRPRGAYYSNEMREFILPYAVLRHAENPDAMLLDFAQSTYNSAAELGHWDREALERQAAGSAPEQTPH